MKKISCVMIAIFSMFIMSVSAFALGDIPLNINSDLEIIEINKDDFLNFLSNENDKQLAIDIVNKANASSLISVTSVRSQNEISVGLCVAQDGSDLSVVSQKIDNSKKYQEINIYVDKNYKMLRFVYNSNGAISGVGFTDFPKSNYIYSNYINSSLSIPINKISSNYNYIDSTIKQIKFIDDNNGSSPTVPSNPDVTLNIPNNPNSTLNIPKGDEYVPYDTQATLSGFFGMISSNIGVSTNIGLLILAIVVGIPLILRIIKKFTKV